MVGIITPVHSRDHFVVELVDAGSLIVPSWLPLMIIVTGFLILVAGTVMVVNLLSDHTHFREGSTGRFVSGLLVLVAGCLLASLALTWSAFHFTAPSSDDVNAVTEPAGYTMTEDINNGFSSRYSVNLENRYLKYVENESNRGCLGKIVTVDDGHQLHLWCQDPK